MEVLSHHLIDLSIPIFQFEGQAEMDFVDLVFSFPLNRIFSPSDVMASAVGEWRSTLEIHSRHYTDHDVDTSWRLRIRLSWASSIHLSAFMFIPILRQYVAGNTTCRSWSTIGISGRLLKSANVVTRDFAYLYVMDSCIDVHIPSFFFPSKQVGVD